MYIKSSAETPPIISILAKMMLGKSNNFLKSHALTTQTLPPNLHNHFRYGEGNVSSSIPIPRRSKQRNLRLCRGASTEVKPSLLTPVEKSTSVKVVITVLDEDGGGLLSNIGINQGLDGLTDLLGRTLLVELVAAQLDASKSKFKLDFLLCYIKLKIEARSFKI